MGIENFYKWLKQNYPTCILVPEAINKYNNIYIDCNHILHHSLNKDLIRTLNIIFSNFIANKNIIIATDGPAPYAKVILQRIRRQGGGGEREIGGEEDEFLNATSLDLTPGTEYMRGIDELLSNYVASLELSYKKIHPNCKYIGSTIPDEGELKLFNHLVKTDPFDKNLIIGNDADLIVMACAMDRDINILTHYGGGRELVVLGEFKRMFYEDYGGGLRDFAFLALLLGNDYLPKLNFVKFDNILNSYKYVIGRRKKSLIEPYSQFPNMDILVDIIIDIMTVLSKQFRSIRGDNIDNYFKGLVWCMNMYSKGECSMYDYTYEGERAPSPADLLIYCISKRGEKIEVPISGVGPLDIEYYTLLIMPKTVKDKYIPKKYHTLIENELKYLYEREDCGECLEMRTELRTAMKEKVGEKISQASIKYNNHKKLYHITKFNVGDIKKIITLTTGLGQ